MDADRGRQRRNAVCKLGVVIGAIITALIAATWSFLGIPGFLVSPSFSFLSSIRPLQLTVSVMVAVALITPIMEPYLGRIFAKFTSLHQAVSNMRIPTQSLLWLNDKCKLLAPVALYAYLAMVAFYVAIVSSGIHGGLWSSDGALTNIFGIDDSDKLERHVVHLPIFVLTVMCKMLFTPASVTERDALWSQFLKAVAKIALLVATVCLAYDDLFVGELLTMISLFQVQPATLNVIISFSKYRSSFLIGRPSKPNDIVAQNILIVLVPLSIWTALFLGCSCVSVATEAYAWLYGQPRILTYDNQFYKWLMPCAIVNLALQLTRSVGIILQTWASYKRRHQRLLGGFYSLKLGLKITEPCGNAFLCIIALYHTSSNLLWCAVIAIPYISYCVRSAAAAIKGHRSVLQLRHRLATMAGTVPSTTELRQYDDECSVCSEELTEPASGLKVRLTCSHIYHAECVLQWILARAADSDKCPICKIQILQT